MNQVHVTHVQEKIISGRIYALIETFGTNHDGVPFYKNRKLIGQQFVVKTYHLINEQYVLMYENDNLASDESFHYGLILDFEDDWEHEWWPNVSGDH